MISVVISTHNRLEKLKKAIESVKKQTFTDWELIIVDDCSTDGTWQYLKALKDPKIIPHKMKVNFGNDTKPKNTGILLSKGELVAFLDDDNTYRPDHLQALYKTMENNPGIDLVYGDRWVNDLIGNIGNGIGVYSDFKPQLLIRKNYIDTSDVLVRRQALFDVGGFDERYKKYVDWNLWLRMAKAGKKFLRVPQILTDYFIDRDGKSQRKEDQQQPGVPAWNPEDLEIEVPYLDIVRKPRVAIFTLTYDRLDYTKECFESLGKTAGYKFDHFVIDNGSTDGTREWLEKEWGSRTEGRYYILNDKNKGISIGSNQALDMISEYAQLDGPYNLIGKVDNDCKFLNQGWLAKMVELWKSNHMMAFSCAVQGLRDNPGGAQRLAYGVLKDQYLGLTEHLGGICIFADKLAYKDFRWAEDSFLHGVQDVEFSKYLVKEGFQPAYLENFYCEHIHGTTGQEKDHPDYFERRKKERTEKYVP